MKKIAALGMVLVAVGLMAGCGGSSGGSSGGGTDLPTITSISELPKATSPMASASASISKDGAKAAATGLNLLSTTASTFNSSSTQSRGACEMINQMREGVSGAMQADMILCFMAQMDAAGVMPGNVYDGVYHVANLPSELTEGDSGTPSRVKVKVVKDSSGKISEFKMFMCKKKDTSLPVTDSNLDQSEYTSMTISGASLTMRAVGKYTDPSGQGYGWHSTDVTGDLNSSGAFTSKDIVVKNIGSWGGVGNFNWQDGTLTQLPGGFTFYGYRIGDYSNEGGSGSWQDKIYGAGQMIGDTSATPANLAMGDGAMNVVTQGTYNSPQYGSGSFGPETILDAWLGDGALALADDTQSEYYTTAQNGALPTPVTGLTEGTISSFIAFGTGETWDCTDDTGLGVEQIGSISEATIMNACSQYGQGGGNWINCYEIFEQQQ